MPPDSRYERSKASQLAHVAFRLDPWTVQAGLANASALDKLRQQSVANQACWSIGLRHSTHSAILMWLARNA